MPTIDEIFPKHASSNDKAARGCRGNLPQERATYSAKRRQMDLDVRVAYDMCMMCIDVQGAVHFFYMSDYLTSRLA